jgi:cytochrome c5
MKPFSMSIAVLSLLAASGSTLAASDRMEDGRESYQAACASCHDAGINDAPQTRNPQDWADRSNLWQGVLFEHAEKGYLKMPAKGGNKDVSAYDVDAAAEYMLTITHPEMPRD